MKKKVYYIYKDKKYESIEELLPNMSNDDLLDLREIIVDKFAEEMIKDDEERKTLKKYYITKAIISGALIVASIFIDNSSIKFGFIGTGVGLWLYFPTQKQANKFIENDINEVFSLVEEEIYARKTDHEIFPDFFDFPTEEEIDERIKSWEKMENTKKINDILDVEVEIL